MINIDQSFSPNVAAFDITAIFSLSAFLVTQVNDMLEAIMTRCNYVALSGENKEPHLAQMPLE